TEICAVLAFSAVNNNDKVGIIFFTDKVQKYIPPKKGRVSRLLFISSSLTFLRISDVVIFSFDYYYSPGAKKNTFALMIIENLTLNIPENFRWYFKEPLLPAAHLLLHLLHPRFPLP